MISGQVQGVGYRAATWDTANRLELNGWVRNLADRRVEAVFEGAKDSIERMIQWCHQGPPSAQIQTVTVEYESAEGLQGFQIVD